MHTKPIATISIILLFIAMTFVAPIFDTSIYGVNGHPTDWMSFMPSSPFRHMGIGWISSPFIHLSLEHLAVNLFFFIPIAMMIERKKSATYLGFLFLVIHFQVLMALVLIDQFYSLEDKGFLGSSHIVIGLYSFWFLHNKRYGLFTVTLTVLVSGLWQSQSPLTTLAHGLGFLIGIVTLIFSHFIAVTRFKRSN